ncbi:MAG: protein translocase subunit SecF [Gammaproteobacteria bacterium]|nr:protein translocase subunit SecF [Gammaproteobacteria bacterium]
MEIIKQSNLEFMKYRKTALIISALLIVLSIASLAFRGLNFGIDFTGGTLVEVGYPQNADLADIRKRLDGAGFADAQLQHFGTAKDVLIRLAPRPDVSQSELSSEILNALSQSQRAEVRRIEFVGPQIGEELREDGGFAVLYALLGILIYVAFRFEYRFAIGAVIALAHDVLITLGFFSISGIEFNLPVLAAILAVIGYSLNDTIVIYDRVRESFIKFKDTAEKVINKSVNLTLARTLITSLTTLLVLIALLIFGGEILTGFTAALIVGVIVGTYSSIYIASLSILMMGINYKHIIPAKKEGVT